MGGLSQAIRTPADAARVIKTARLEQSLTQQEVADAVGVSRQVLARIEQGSAASSFMTYLRIFSYLGVNLSAHSQGDARGQSERLESSSASGGSSEDETVARADARLERLRKALTETSLPEL